MLGPRDAPPKEGRVVEAVGDGLTTEVNRYFELDKPSLS